MITIARTSFEKAKGFMGRDYVEPDEAILFDGIGAGAQFHMRTVGCKLGIVALDSKFRVIDKAVMEPELGGWTTPNGTCYVLECIPEVSIGMQIGFEPQWTLFESDRPEAIIKKEAAKSFGSKNIIAEMVKEIKRLNIIDTDDADAFVVYLNEIIGDNFLFESADADVFTFQPRDAEVDKSFYGSDDVGPSDSRSVLAVLIEDVFGSGAVNFDNHRLKIASKAFALCHWSIRGETINGRKIVACRRIEPDGKAVAIMIVVGNLLQVRCQHGIGVSHEDYERALLDMVKHVM